MNTIIDTLNELMKYPFIRSIVLIFLIVCPILGGFVHLSEKVNREKTAADTPKKNIKPRRTKAERIAIYKAGISFSLMGALFFFCFAFYCFSNKDELTNNTDLSTVIFISLILAALLTVNIIRLYLKKKRIDNEIQENKAEAVNFMKESHEYNKNYTPIISKVKSQTVSKEVSYEGKDVSCNDEKNSADNIIPTEANIINDKELMQKYDEECIRWKEKQEQRKLIGEDTINNIFSFIRKNFLRLLTIAVSIIIFIRIYARTNGVSLNDFTHNSSAGTFNPITNFGPVIFCFVIFCIIRNKKPVEKSNVIYNEIIPQMIRAHFGNEAVFSQESGFDCSEIYSNNSFRYHCYKTESAYFIKGTYRNMKFQLSCEHIYWGRIESTDSGKEVVPETLFNGFLICTEIPRQVESHLGVYSHRISELNDILENDIEPATENLNFSRLFEIKCDNEENIYYILTPDMMERITSLHPDMSNAYDELHIYWHDNKMYVGIAMNTSRMNIRDPKKGRDGYMQIKTQIESELKRAETALEVVLKLL